MKVFVFAEGFNNEGLGGPKVCSSLALAKFYAQAAALQSRGEEIHPDYYSITECTVDGDEGAHHQALWTPDKALEWEVVDPCTAGEAA